MIDLVLHIAAGAVLGSVTGLLPGVGASLIVLSAWPWLLGSDLLNLFAFYIVLLTTSQYFSSISAIMYGIMGETTAGPAVTYGRPMMHHGYGIYALRYTAYASLCSALLAVCLAVVPLLYFDSLRAMLTGNVRLLVITVFFAVLIMINRQPLLTTLMIVGGLLMAQIGFNDILQQHLLMPGYTIFDAGLPFEPLMIGALVIPVLIDGLRQNNHSDVNSFRPQRPRQHGWIPPWAIIRGSMVGWFAGLIPGISYMISSNFAAAIERRLKPTSTVRPLLAAEAANNSGAISAILPMLIFAIPVVPSEVLLLNIAEFSGFTPALAKEFLYTNWWRILMFLLIINVILFLVASRIYALMHAKFQDLAVYLYAAVLLLLVPMIFVVAGKYDGIYITMISVSVGMIMGFMIKNFEAKTAGIIGFLLSDQYLSEIYRQLLILGVI